MSHESPAFSGRASARAVIIVVTAVMISVVVSRLQAAVGALTVAVALGAIVANVKPPSTPVMLHLKKLERHLLRGGIVFLGLQLSVMSIADLGLSRLVVVAVTLIITFFGTIALGRTLRIDSGLTVLVATGFAICGASAIAAMSEVKRSRDHHVGTAVALVTLYGSLAIAIAPLIQHLLGLSDSAFGLWVGASIHEVGQVAAAAAPAGAVALAVAVVAKLTRVVALAPIVTIASLVDRGEDRSSAPLVPGFLVGFLIMVLARSTNMLPGEILDAAHALSTGLLAAGLFCLGLAIRFRDLIHTGKRALILGFASTVLAGSAAWAMMTLLSI